MYLLTLEIPNPLFCLLLCSLGHVVGDLFSVTSSCLTSLSVHTVPQKSLHNGRSVYEAKNMKFCKPLQAKFQFTMLKIHCLVDLWIRKHGNRGWEVVCGS